MEAPIQPTNQPSYLQQSRGGGKGACGLANSGDVKNSGKTAEISYETHGIYSAPRDCGISPPKQTETGNFTLEKTGGFTRATEQPKSVWPKS
jgi:hypothetical protein